MINLQVMVVLQQNFRHFSNELGPLLLGVYDSWVLLIEESYLPSGPYLRRIISEKRLGAQNEKYPNRDMQNYLKTGK